MLELPGLPGGTQAAGNNITLPRLPFHYVPSLAWPYGGLIARAMNLSPSTIFPCVIGAVCPTLVWMHKTRAGCSGREATARTISESLYALLEKTLGPLIDTATADTHRVSNVGNGLPTICQPQFVKFLPYLYDRLTMNPARIVADTIT